jgi:hypothetical protein
MVNTGMGSKKCVCVSQLQKENNGVYQLHNKKGIRNKQKAIIQSLVTSLEQPDMLKI